jgi:hypothetical protein
VLGRRLVQRVRYSHFLSKKDKTQENDVFWKRTSLFKWTSLKRFKQKHLRKGLAQGRLKRRHS